MTVNRSRLLSTCLALPMLCLGVGAASAQSPDDALLDRDHAGELAANGGARRLKGDITAAFRAQIKDGPAKNVILLIGDGMGDSEITIARNVALGAGQAVQGHRRPAGDRPVHPLRARQGRASRST